MTSFTKVAAVALIIAAGSAVSAQDWTNVDINALNNQWNADLNATMQTQLNEQMWLAMNDPNVQQLYVSQINSGLFYGSFEDFAYKYMYTGGFTAEGYDRAIGTNADLNNRHQTMMNGYWNNMGNYQGAYDVWGNRYAENQGQAGTIMLGY